MSVDIVGCRILCIGGPLSRDIVKDVGKKFDIQQDTKQETFTITYNKRKLRLASSVIYAYVDTRVDNPTALAILLSSYRAGG